VTRVAVLDHGMGNLRSVAKALEAVGAEVSVTAEPGELRRADGLCVPGQGVFGRCMSRLSSTSLGDAVRDWIAAGRPLLGICLGMQVLFESSEERGPVAGLGIFAGRVARLPDSVTVPHIGWNTVFGADASQGEHFYFDHSYVAHPDDPSIVSGWCRHGSRFAASIASGTVFATQFHPEKSGAAGLRLLEGWVRQRELARR
jgi:glutamine amidotransferase